VPNTNETQYVWLKDMFGECYRTDTHLANVWATAGGVAARVAEIDGDPNGITLGLRYKTTELAKQAVLEEIRRVMPPDERRRAHPNRVDLVLTT